MPTTAETLQRIKELITQLSDSMDGVADLASAKHSSSVAKAHQLASELFERLSVIKNTEPQPVAKPIAPAVLPEVVPVPEPVVNMPAEPATLFNVDPIVVEKPEPKKTPSAKKANLKKIDDLKAAVGLNEKFRFINELFSGSQQEYNIAINQLNNVPDLDEALIYFESLKNIYNWDASNECYVKLMELVHRRFA